MKKKKKSTRCVVITTKMGHSHFDLLHKYRIGKNMSHTLGKLEGK